MLLPTPATHQHTSRTSPHDEHTNHAPPHTPTHTHTSHPFPHKHTDHAHPTPTHMHTSHPSPHQHIMFTNYVPAHKRTIRPSPTRHECWLLIHQTRPPVAPFHQKGTPVNTCVRPSTTTQGHKITTSSYDTITPAQNHISNSPHAFFPPPIYNHTSQPPTTQVHPSPPHHTITRDNPHPTPPCKHIST